MKSKRLIPFQICCNINIFVSKLKITAGIKKILRILLWSAAGILLLLGVCYTLLRTSYVQTFLVRYVTEQIETHTGVKIRIGGVDFRPMHSLVLQDVLLKDFKADTLLFCQDLRVKMDSFSVVNRNFNISELELDKACFHLWISRGQENAATNVEMFLDSLLRREVAGQPREQSAEKGSWLVGLQRIRLKRSHFTYREAEKDTVEYGVNWTDVDCRELSAEISDIDFSGGPVRAVVSGLSFTEKSGLRMENMSGKVKVTSGVLLVTDANIRLERSNLDLVKLEFKWTPDQHDWRYFTSRVRQYYELGPSAVSFIDLAYFNGILRGIDNTVKCSGIVTNTIDQLEGHDLYFELGEKSVFQGSFQSIGLPDVRNTVFNIELHQAHLHPNDLKTVYLPWFDRYIPMPAPLQQMSYLDFDRINFDGTLADFIVRAKSVTPDLAGELSFRYAPCADSLPDCASMGGEFRFGQVNLGKLAGQSLVGYGSCSGSYAGTWNEEGPAFHMKTKLHRLEVKRGTIREAEVAMIWENQKLDLMASVDNEEVKADMVLAYDSRDEVEFLSTRGKVELNRLSAFGWKLGDGEEQVSAGFELVHAGRDERGFTNLSLSDLVYSNGTGSFAIDGIMIEDNRSEERDVTTINSDVGELLIEGNYKEVRPLPFILRLLQNYLPAYSDKKTRRSLLNEHPEKYNFHCAMRVKDADRVLKVLYPQLGIAAGASVVTDFRQGDEKLTLKMIADTIRYDDVILVKSEVDLVGDAENLKLKYKADRLLYGSVYRLYNLHDELNLANDRIDNKISWCNWEDKTYSGELSAGIIFTMDGKRDSYTTEIRIHPGVVVMADSVWHVDGASVFINGKEIAVDCFKLRRGNEYLSVDGHISDDPEEKLSIDLNHFDLSMLARIALEHGTSLFGTATGTLTLQDYYKDFLLISDFRVEDWGIGRDTLGTLRLRSFWDMDSRSLIVGAENQVGADIPLQVSGYYTPATDSLQVDVRLKEVGLERLGIYAADYVSGTQGLLSGEVNISGLARQPDFSGYLYLDSVGLKVNVLNTNFFVHDSIRIVNNRLLFEDFQLKDRYGRTAVLDGEYRVWEKRYRLAARLENFMVLNTDYIHNELFYGQMFLSGLVELDNANGATNVTINATTENESHLYLPLTSVMTEQSSNFLHFVNAGQTEARREQLTYRNEDINLNANLEINEHLDVQVIFDPTVGDVLKASGNGDVKFAFDKDGNLSMFGIYQISKGDYLFTLSNLVNKKFILTPGGTISWSGSPYDAMLDINAVYNLKTTISELLPAERSSGEENGTGTDDKVSDSGRKVPVECILNLSDNLTNPVVKFDINFPTLETQSKSYLQSLFSSQDEINKQMFSLLLLNRFYKTDNVTDYGNQAQTAGVTTLTEMFTNQLSRWISQFSNNLDIGFAYRLGNQDEMSSDELELAVSTQLLNDRITISANGNVDVGNNKNAAGEDGKRTNIAGDFDIEVKLNKQGSLKMKAYSHTDEKLLYNNTETIQGVGVSYQESFDTLRELLRKYFRFLRKKK